MRVIILATAVSIIMEPLTWIFDRTLFRGAYQLEYSANFILAQIRKPFGVVIFDLNYFKESNDSYGHHKGDEVLIAFGQALQKTFDKHGLDSGLGGDEFAVIIDGHYDDIDLLIQELSGILKAHQDLIVSNLEFSFAYQKHEDGISPDELCSLADHKMYARNSMLRTSRLHKTDMRCNHRVLIN